MVKQVKVIWEDAALESHNISPEEVETLSPVLRENIGFLAYKSKEKVIVIFGTIYDKDKNLSVCDQSLVIPKGMVREIKELK